MAFRTASPRPFPYSCPQHNLFHRGVVSVTGSLIVNLGINHNNFYVTLNLKGGNTDLSAGLTWGWDYGTQKGTFVITVLKMAQSGVTPFAVTWVADTSPRNIAFLALAESSVSE